MDDGEHKELDALDLSEVVNLRIDGCIRPLFAQMESGSRPDIVGTVNKYGVICGEHNKYARLGEGFYLVSAIYPEGYDIGAAISGEGLFEIHFCLKGSLSLNGDWGEVKINGPRLLFWYHPKGTADVSQTASAGTTGYHGVSVYCDHIWLEKQTLGGDEAIVSVWNQYVQTKSDIPHFRVLPLPTDSLSALDEVLENVGDDGLTLLQFKGRAFELVAHAFQIHAEHSANITNSGFKMSDLRKIATARDIIQSDFMSPPSNRELAKAVGINVSKLMSGFKHQYGMTIRSLVKQLRMEKARDLLLTTDLSVSSIAYKVGFAHHSTFTAAFKGYYNMSPKQVVASKRSFGNLS